MNSHFVNLWHGELLPIDREEKAYWVLLSDDEKKKASTFSRQDLQQKYIKTRGMVRTILAFYLKQEASTIIIKQREHGKPFVPNENLYFNLSHTGNRLVVAVSNCTELGIDIEQNKKRKSLPALAEKCFSNEEVIFWNALSEQKKVSFFYCFWVRKEAFVKAVGRGLGIGLNQCSIDLNNQDFFSRIPTDYGVASDWKIIDVLLDKNHTCAIVTKDIKFEFKEQDYTLL